MEEARSAAVVCAAQLAREGGAGSQALADAQDILCNAFPTIDAALMRVLLAEHCNDAASLHSALCLVGGAAPAARAPSGGANRAQQADDPFEAELALAMAVSASEAEAERAWRGDGGWPPAVAAPQPLSRVVASAPSAPQLPPWTPPVASAVPPPLPQWLQQPRAPPQRAPEQWQQQRGGRGGRGGGFNNGARGRGRGGASFSQQQRPFVPHFPAGCPSRAWFPAWLPDGRIVPVAAAAALAPPLPPPPLAAPLVEPIGAAAAADAADAHAAAPAQSPWLPPCDETINNNSNSNGAPPPPLPLSGDIAWDADAEQAWAGGTVPAEMAVPLVPAQDVIAPLPAEPAAAAGDEDAAAYAPAAFLREMFPDIPYDMECLIEALGVDKAQAMCFEMQAQAHQAAADAAVAAEWDAANSGEGGWGEEEAAAAALMMSDDEKLAMLTQEFPALPLAGLLQALQLHGGSVDGAMAELLQAEGAEQAAVSSAQQAQQAPQLTHTLGGERGKVAQLRRAFPGASEELILDALRSCVDAPGGALLAAAVQLRALGLDVPAGSTAGSDARAPQPLPPSAARRPAASQGARFAAAATAAAAAPPPRRAAARRAPPTDGPTHREIRAAADAAFEERRRCIQLANEAYQRGDSAEAKRFSDLARAHMAQGQQANASASQLELQLKNAHAVHTPPPLDLHGQTVAEAMVHARAWVTFFCGPSAVGTNHLRIITGKGLHSVAGAKILPAVEEYLSALGIPYTLTSDGGCVDIVSDVALREQLRERRDGGNSAATAAGAAGGAQPAAVGSSSRFEDIKRGGVPAHFETT